MWWPPEVAPRGQADALPTRPLTRQRAGFDFDTMLSVDETTITMSRAVARADDTGVTTTPRSGDTPAPRPCWSWRFGGVSPVDGKDQRTPTISSDASP